MKNKLKPENLDPKPSHASTSAEKKAYRPPELLEWGSILDLTEGPQPFSLEDGFGMGGTTPV